MSLTRIERSPLLHPCRYRRDDLLELLGPHAEYDYDIELIEGWMSAILGWDLSGWFWPGLDGKYCSVRYFERVLRKASCFSFVLPERVSLFRVSLGQLRDLSSSRLVMDGRYGFSEEEDPMEWDEVMVGDFLVLAHFFVDRYENVCVVLNVIRPWDGREVAERVAASVLSDARSWRLCADCVEVWEVCADA